MIEKVGEQRNREIDIRSTGGQVSAILHVVLIIMMKNHNTDGAVNLDKTNSAGQTRMFDKVCESTHGQVKFI